MRPSDSGFTLTELLILLGVLCLAAACLTPNVIGSRDGALELGDRANLMRHFEWLQVCRSKHNGALPLAGGHKFVLATWTANVFDHTPENFDRFWTPGPTKDNDANYADLRKLVQRGENPWPDLAQTRSEDTHYVGRSKEHARTAERSAEEAWMANDNEGGWSLPAGTVNVLFCGGVVRTYSYQLLQEQFGLGPFDGNAPVVSWGQGSPIAACQKLDN